MKLATAIVIASVYSGHLFAQEIIPINCLRGTDGTPTFQIKKASYSRNEITNQLAQIATSSSSLRLTMALDMPAADLIPLLIAAQHLGIKKVEITPPHSCTEDILSRLPTTDVTVTFIGWETRPKKIEE